MLEQQGQSIWLDNISRDLIRSGKLIRMIELGLKGITSNPTIFDKSISLSSDYDSQILELSCSRGSVFDIYDEITVDDVRSAAKMFLDVYKETAGLDGYVSLEVNPRLALNAEETIREAQRLHKKLGLPNVMLKIPATDEGFIAAEELISRGINVNITLIFSQGQYINTVNAYINGIEKLIKNNGDPKDVRSVASVFVSRLDTVVDRLLGPGHKLRGRAAVTNCQLIYNKFIEVFNSEMFLSLKKRGANIQRPLWASTSTKDASYSDIKYVTELIARDTVNTLPENTFWAFVDHGTINHDLSSENTQTPAEIINSLNGLQIDIQEICAGLLRDGLSAFEKSFDSLLNSISQKSKVLCNR
ncbi:MAG: transaldolase [Candidatus Omnitrophota bacterium]|jgi:transaldolase/transaldolase/glucose-6-phosphate isomerase|nr:MAG: transaldolase [Candidatus Omnitrophota bacterium]